MKKLKVENHEDPIRLDKYLKKILNNIKQSSIEEYIRKKKIKIEKIQDKLHSGYRIKNEDMILISNEIYNKYQNENKKEPKNENYKPDKKIIDLFKQSILFENENFLVLNKPAGFACQGGINIINSIDKIMRFFYGNEIRIVHRLDKETSGILLMAKNLKYAQFLTKLFKEKTIEKTYYAICEDNTIFHEEKRRIIEKQIVEINKPLKSKKIGGEEKIVIDFEDGDEAISYIKLEKHLSDNLFLLEIKPKTGRKHQIRAHLNSIELPILGDKKYNLNYKKLNQKNMFLHAGKIKIEEKNLKFEIECNLPEYFLDLIQEAQL